MKNVHGKFNSFAELGKALGIKVPQNVAPSNLVIN